MPFPDRAERAAILAIGSELTEGRIDNTNASWLSRRLRRIDLEVALHLAVPDEPALMRRALEEAARAARFVLVTGGLGPTQDDRTREVAAELAGAPLEEHAPSLARVEAIFQALGRPMAANNRSQALFPRGAVVLPNERGTAPGFCLEALDAVLFFLPGIPSELRPMVEREVEPRLLAERRPEAVLRAGRLGCFGLAESAVDALLEGLWPDDGPVRMGLNVTEGVIEVHLVAAGPEPEAADRLLAEALRRAREALGAHCFGEGEQTLAEALLLACRRRGARLGFAESCTGGLAAHLVSLVPGASDTLRGGVVAYADAVKRERLAVPAALLEAHGAVSEAVALAMAEGALDATGADVAAAITGVAGPGGGSADKPVGTVFIAAAGRGPAAGIRACRRLRLRGQRGWIQRLSALSAIDLVRRALTPAP